MTFPAISNWQHTPPMGGWNVSVILNDHKIFAQGHTPFAVLSSAMQQAKSIGSDISESEMKEYLNQLWIERDPVRAIGGQPTPRRVETTETKRVTTTRKGGKIFIGPSRWGTQAWLWLNTFGVPGCFDRIEWESMIRRLERMLSPARSPSTGCSECFKEWLQISKDSNPLSVIDNKQAAKWVFEAHNRVNKKLGKPALSWETVAAVNGWEI